MNAPTLLKESIDRLNDQELNAVLNYIGDINGGKYNQNSDGYKKEALRQIRSALKSEQYWMI